jgi:hypothetical protein
VWDGQASKKKRSSTMRAYCGSMAASLCSNSSMAIVESTKGDIVEA